MSAKVIPLVVASQRGETTERVRSMLIRFAQLGDVDAAVLCARFLDARASGDLCAQLELIPELDRALAELVREEDAAEARAGWGGGAP